VLFQPEITPFIRLFTKRVQLQKPVEPAVYAAAPWWERAILSWTACPILSWCIILAFPECVMPSLEL
jgi:hypothetical protein